MPKVFALVLAAGQGTRIGVAILSYNGGVSFGVTGDFDAVPEVDEFCREIERQVAELLELARRRTQPRRAPGRGRAATRRQAAS
jgi:hypothetical protein